MRGVVWMVGMALIGQLGVHGAAATEPPGIDYVLQNIKRTRPRLFLNAETLEKIRRKGLTLDQEQWLATLRKRVDGYPAPPELDDKLAAHMLSEAGGQRYAGNDSKGGPRVFEGNWGYYSAHAALTYLLTGEKKYYDRAVEFLEHAAGIYTVINTNHRIPYGKAFGRLSALSAYDWLYNDLPKAQREEIGQSLFTSLHSFYKHWRTLRPGNRDIYTDNLMGWHLGLVFWGTGVKGADDAFCAELLRFEYNQWRTIFGALAADPDGVWLYGALGYSTQNLQSEANFLDAWRSAVGGNFARYFPKRAYMPSYFLWNTIAPTRRPPLCYGWSDGYHTDNEMGATHRPYLNRVADLYADLGDEVDLGALKAIAQLQAPMDYQQFLPKEPAACWLTSASPLLMPLNPCTEEEIQAVLARLPRARHFPDPLGQTFMNSGWGENDTYAMFIAGRQTPCRKHYDENHFTIYKKGFLALDSGARGRSVNRSFFGAADDPRNIAVDHEINYYYDTLAHNSILISMEGEKLPGYWGQPSDINTGGMNRNYGAQVKAFETNDRFTYIASDATGCYHEEKSQEVVRQFLFLYPDYFVVFDRVTSKTPEQRKTWLLHTQHEPEARGDTFFAEHREGKVFVRTLLPQAFRSEKIGGPSKEFWAGGRNWPVRKDGEEDWQKLTPDQHVFGCYRMEISSTQPHQRELFLHLIQVGDRLELQEMAPSCRVESGQQVGVEFRAGKATVRVLFNSEGVLGGSIRIDEDGQAMNRPLTPAVMSQKGLALKQRTQSKAQ